MSGIVGQSRDAEGPHLRSASLIDPHQQNHGTAGEPIHMEREDPPPLQLEDSHADSEHDEGESTRAVTPPEAQPDEHPNLKLASSGSGSQSASASPGSSTMSSGTTGGFDTMLGRLVVRAGLATEDEVQELRRTISRMESAMSEMERDK
jgi:hypothetical protein